METPSRPVMAIAADAGPDPERPDLYWTNPMAVPFSHVKISNLILADHEGHVVEGDYAINQAGFVLHGAVHEAHPDIIAMCHAHTEYGTAFAALGKALEPISQDSCAFFEDHAVILDEAGAVTLSATSLRSSREAKSMGRRSTLTKVTVDETDQWTS